MLKEKKKKKKPTLFTLPVTLAVERMFLKRFQKFNLSKVWVNIPIILLRNADSLK